ncbi:ScbA/BarX family gamma-butyrolactone biosynthesis protein (plasmid) [Streptomyces sp. DSM 116496]|uniref:ScbA/BarX family gamma-butyrolactone biosynthesis protein n=1 Tax=Streptomyces stoeckheimensis TaxID=3344656 RepID=UPI0038B40CD4
MPYLASAVQVPFHGSALTLESGITRPSATAVLPRLTTTVPREYVHRAAVSEVLLTGWTATGLSETDSPDTFEVRAQWPRSHSLFAQTGGYQDPMLLIESVRQIGSLLAHAEFGVPFGHQFLMWDMSFTTTPELLVAGAAPTEVELRTVCHDIVRRGRGFGGMRYEVTALRDGKELAVGGAAFSCTSPAVHRRLRGDRPTSTFRRTPAPINPADVGHASERHVVLAAPGPGAANRWELRVDTAHPTFFDHPVDHVPGMVLLEAARQAAHASTGMPGALLVGLESNFERYAEFDAPCWIEAHPEPERSSGRTLVRVRGTQHARTVFTADLVLSPR